MARAATIDEYIAAFAEPGRSTLAQLCTLASETVPDAVEAIKWGQPAWVHRSGTILFAVAGYTKHANFAFTPSTRAAFAADLADFATGKGTVKLPYGDPVPGELLRRMMEFRVREYERDGVLWM